MGKTLSNENVDRYFSLAKNIVKACAHMIQVSHTICRPGVCNHPESARFLNKIRSLMRQNVLKTLVAESYTLRTNNRMRQLCRWNYPKDQSEGWHDNFSLQKRQSYGQSRPRFQAYDFYSCYLLCGNNKYSQMIHFKGCLFRTQKCFWTLVSRPRLKFASHISGSVLNK